MSDFDKEAEREKLRKKYERDQADRQATQRMSDLLLKGATMTNTHCDVCGDPYFRQNGVTFCPSCHGGPEGVEANVPEDDTDNTGHDASGAETQMQPTAKSTATEDDATVDVAPTSSAVDSSSDDRDREPASDSDAHVPSAGGQPESPSGRSERTPSPSVSGTASRTSDSPDGDVEVAHDALVTALERFSRAAAETDDPHYAKSCLEAAHEAAETLSTLRH